MTTVKKEKTPEQKAAHAETQRRYREKKKAAAAVPAEVVEVPAEEVVVEAVIEGVPFVAPTDPAELTEPEPEVAVEVEPEIVVENGNMIRLSVGEHRYDNLPVQHTAASFDVMRDRLLSAVSPRKHMAFFCAPFAVGFHDDQVKFPGEKAWRLGRLVLPRPWLSFDCDGFGYPDAEEDSEMNTPAECCEVLLQRCSSLKAFAHTTSSHTDELPRLRLTLALGRPVTRAEGIALGKALESVLAPNGGVLFDKSVYQGEQPCYLPVQADGRPPFKSWRFDGNVIDPDLFLVGFVEPEAGAEREVVEWDPVEISRAESALMAIPNDLERADWFKLLSSAKEAGVSKECAEVWSSQFDYKNERKQRKADREFPYQWNSIKLGKADGVSADFLFKEARKAGWEDPAIAEMFGDVEADITPRAEILAGVEEMANLDELGYQQYRKAAAKHFGISVAVLDDMVTAKKKERAAAAAAAGGAGADGGGASGGIAFAAVEPWETPVDGAALLKETIDLLERHVVCDQSTKVAVALWVLHTWFIDVVDVSPLGSIQAPEKECGKTTLLDFIGRLVFRPLPSSNISSAAVYRVVEAYSPCLMIDEVDSFLKNNEDMRGIINSGHTRTSAVVIRTVGDDHEPKQFSTWGAKLLCGIGKLPETLTSRSVIFHLRRKTKDEKVTRMRRKTGGFDDLKRKIARFAADNTQKVREAQPVLPEELGDRAQDNWEPLLAIADLCGIGWSVQARNVACTISGVEPASAKAELLADIRKVFDGLKDSQNPDRIPTDLLLWHLIQDNEKPWSTYNRGRPMNASQLAKRLKDYDIQSKNIRIGEAVLKGFTIEQFEDAWARYLPATSEAAATESKEENG